MAAAQPLRVLIVDDEAPARSRLRDLLTDCALKMPIEIAGEAENGRQALELMPQCDADVVGTDSLICEAEIGVAASPRASCRRVTWSDGYGQRIGIDTSCLSSRGRSSSSGFRRYS